MVRVTPISWSKFVKNLRALGFVGPYQQGKHPYMLKGDLVLTIPNPHDGDIGVNLLIRILRQAGISRDSWINI